MNQIGRLRKNKKYSQATLAQKIGVDRTTIARWETGQASPRSGLLASLANALGCSLEDILVNPQEVA